MVWCPPGDVTEYRSDLVNEFDEDLPSGVIAKYRISKGFWISQYEITQEQWAQVMAGNPSAYKGRDKPVHNVSWEDTRRFLTKLGDGWRLPSNAEWEFACRAETSSSYSFGDNPSDLARYGFYGQSVLNGLNPLFGGPELETGPKDVGRFRPNPWGIYDMHGNIAEWVQDWWHPELGNPISDVFTKHYGTRRPDSVVKSSKPAPQIDPTGPSRGDTKVIRGGCFFDDGDACRSSAVAFEDPSARPSIVGIRAVYQP
jgi:formylglycine-generating enzyme required for sulfatase activity